MDHFGIGAAMQGMARMFFQSARRSGRTTSLVESVKDGDRIVFANSREAERVLQLCIERGVSVECVVVDPKTPERVFEMGTPEGRSIFDHSWIELMYLQVLERTQLEIDRLERETSGYGAAHRETKRRAMELAKWRI